MTSHLAPVSDIQLTLANITDFVGREIGVSENTLEVEGESRPALVACALMLALG